MAQSNGPNRSNLINLVSAAVDTQIQQRIREIVADHDVTPISILAEYTLSKYDGLYVLPFEELTTLCSKHGIDTKGCRIKYHIVSRIKHVDQQLNLLKDYSFPEIPDVTLVDKYRFQLLSFDGAPHMISAVDAFNKIQMNPSLHDVKLPLKLGQVIVHDFGQVDSRSGFFTRSCLYPVGYHSQKVYTSITNPKEMVLYDCWISDNNGKPLFVISLQGTVVSYDYNIDNSWNNLRSRVHETSIQLNCISKSPRPVDSIGEEYYGLSNRMIQMHLEKQSATLQCKGYLFCYQREALGRASTIIRREALLQKQQEECNSYRSKLIQSCLDEGTTQVAKAAVDIAATKYHEFMKESRRIEQMKRDEMKDREEALTMMNKSVVETMMKREGPDKVENHIKVKFCDHNSVDLKVRIIDPMAKKVDPLSQRMESDVSKPLDFPVLEKKTRVKRVLVSRDSSESAYPSRRMVTKTESKMSTRSKGVSSDRSLKNEENLPRSSIRSVFESYSLSFHLGLIHSLTSSKQTPSLPISFSFESDSSFAPPQTQPHSFSFLPSTLISDSLALWDCFCFFSPVFKIPRISYEAFELSLMYPTISTVLDQQLAAVLTLIFTQLRATLMLSDKTLQIPGWKPFVGRPCTVDTWPEFARVLFICKLWVLNGRDVVSVTRLFMEEGRHSLDEIMIVDPIRGVLSRAALASRGEECHEVTQSLTPQDRLLFTRCLAVLRRLRCSPNSELFAEPVDTHDYPDYHAYVAEPMDLHTLADLLVTGAFCKKEHFDVNSFSETLQRIWSNWSVYPKTPSEVMELAKTMETLANQFMKTWVFEAKQGKRGPWDEASFYNQGCKICLLKDEEVREGECVSCDICEASFHLNCLVPPLCSVPEDGWICGLCRGLPTQERWMDEVASTEPNSTSFDTTIKNVCLFGYGPLHPAAGTGSNSYDYKELYDPMILNPVFFGTLPPVDDEESWSEVSLTSRLRRMAILLASEDPSEMTVKSRLMIAQSVVEIARDVPDVIQFVSLSEAAIEKLEAEKEKIGQSRANQIRELCLKMSDSMRKKRGTDGGGEEMENVEGKKGNNGASVKESDEVKKENEEASVKESEGASVKENEGASVKENEGASAKENEEVMEIENDVTKKESDEMTVKENEGMIETESGEEPEKVEVKVEESEPEKQKDEMTNLPADTETLSKSNRPKNWTETEIENLREAVKQVGEGKWTKIAALYGEKLGHRSAPAIREKWRGLASMTTADNSSKSTLVKADTRPLLLPCRFGNVLIMSLGVVCPLHAFYSRHMLYPVGYKALHVLGPPYHISLVCEIEKATQPEPLFVIQWNGVRVQANTPSHVWNEVLRLLNMKSNLNGLEVFGLCIPEVAVAISELHGVNLCNGYEGPLIPSENVSEYADWETVMVSQWHPACSGYAMIPTGEIPGQQWDSEVLNPLFFAFSQNTTSCCDVCGLPGTVTDRLSLVSVCDIDESVKTLMDRGLLNVTMKSGYMHSCCCQMTVRRLQEKIKNLKRELLKMTKISTISEMDSTLLDLLPTTMGHPDGHGGIWYRFRGDDENCYQLKCDGFSRTQWLQASDKPRSPPSLPESFQHTIPSSLQSLITERHLQKLSIPAVQRQPLHAAFYLCRQFPSIFTHDDLTVHFPHCEECGGLKLPSIDHCPHCHLDYAPSLHHECTVSIPPCSSHIRQAKIDLQMLELALPHHQMTKKARLYWSPARRTMWVRKVRRSTNSSQLLACLFILEQCVAKGGLMRWYKWVIPSAQSQMAVTSTASLLIRLRSLDEAMRYVLNQEPGEMEEEEEKSVISKAASLKGRGTGVKPGTPRSSSSSVKSSKSAKLSSSKTEKKEKKIHKVNKEKKRAMKVKAVVESETKSDDSLFDVER